MPVQLLKAPDLPLPERVTRAALSKLRLALPHAALKLAAVSGVGARIVLDVTGAAQGRVLAKEGGAVDGEGPFAGRRDDGGRGPAEAAGEGLDVYARRGGGGLLGCDGGGGRCLCGAAACGGRGGGDGHIPFSDGGGTAASNREAVEVDVGGLDDTGAGEGRCDVVDSRKDLLGRGVKNKQPLREDAPRQIIGGIAGVASPGVIIYLVSISFTGIFQRL